jgi:folylpolyglutamate synthase/dihydropteroate synthase
MLATTAPALTSTVTVAVAIRSSWATPIVAAWHFTAFKSPRAMPPEQLRELLTHFDAPKVPVRCHEDVASALQFPATRRQLVCGSLYLVGEALALVEGEQGSFQSSLQ